jgi:hypothetical protein
MSRFTRPRKTANLSDSVQQQLNKYALAAGAAGVGALVLGQSAEAKVVYTPADESITPNHTIALDLTNNGAIDFRFTDKHLRSSQGFDHTGVLSIAPGGQGNNIEGYYRFSRHYASALHAGISIGPGAQFTHAPKVMATVFSDTGRVRELSNSCDGPWSKATNRYLWLEFRINGEVHFGWARLNVRCQGTEVSALLTGYAYETVANKAIVAGQTEGRDEESSARPDADLTGLAAKQVTLGVLAVGR